MSREKVSISLDKDEKSLRTFKIQHTVKALPLTLWHLTDFFFNQPVTNSRATADSCAASLQNSTLHVLHFHSFLTRPVRSFKMGGFELENFAN